MLAHATTVWTGFSTYETVIAFDANNTLTLKNVHKSHLWEYSYVFLNQ